MVLYIYTIYYLIPVTQPINISTKQNINIHTKWAQQTINRLMQDEFKVLLLTALRWGSSLAVK